MRNMALCNYNNWWRPRITVDCSSRGSGVITIIIIVGLRELGGAAPLLRFDCEFGLSMTPVYLSFQVRVK